MFPSGTTHAEDSEHFAPKKLVSLRLIQFPCRKFLRGHFVNWLWESHGTNYGTGTGLDFTPIDAMKALYWSSVINGVVAVPIMAGLMLLASKKEVMVPFTSGRKTRWFSWFGTAVMAAAVLMMGWDFMR